MFEYRVIHLDIYAENLPAGERTLQDILNDLTKYGWDLVQLMHTGDRKNDEIIVKREKH